MAFTILGVSVWYRPVNLLKPTNTAWPTYKINEKALPFLLAENPPIKVVDENGNPFLMRKLNNTQYPMVVNEMMQVSKILECREYTYAGEQWYEWCAEEAGQWVLYRWEKGRSTLRRII